ncbi:VOC family protein [Patescibacteria group bacterium]|nr:VOC family protein [Patescibacteria group bacterium]
MKLIVDVQVIDLARAVRFYTEVLGLVCRHHDEVWAAIVVGDAEIHLYTDGGVREGVEFYVDDLGARVAELASRGVSFVSGMSKSSAIEYADGITTFPWGRMAFFHDSEGNELVLVKDFA